MTNAPREGEPVSRRSAAPAGTATQTRTAVTMAEVARLADVSTMTVSNVMNNHRSVSTKVRQRVLEAVDASGYVLNHAARSLRKGSTGVIGLAMPELDRPYCGQLAARVIALAAARGYRVAIEQTGAKVEGELDAIALSRMLDCDGLILSAVGIGPDEIRRLGQTIPMVLLGEKSFDGVVDHVAMANFDGGRSATAHLVERGCRRVAWIGGHATADALRLRYEGYLQALQVAGIYTDHHLEPVLATLTMAAGAAGVGQLIKGGHAFDGIVAVTDTVAFGAMRGLADYGLKVPRDVRVIGFDDVLEAQFSIPSLSSISPDHNWMVDTALDMLLTQINGSSRTRAEVIAPYRLVARESTV